MKKIWNSILILALVISAIPLTSKAEQNSKSEVIFNDLEPNHWANQYVESMVKKGILSGYPDKTFRPNNLILKAEMAVVISRMLSLPLNKTENSSFIDVKKTDWYSPYVENAKNYIFGKKGSNNAIYYRPLIPATREEVAVALVKLKGYDEKDLENKSLIKDLFFDYESIDKDSRDYVGIAVEKGIIAGYSDRTFRAQNPITRAELAVLLYKTLMNNKQNDIKFKDPKSFEPNEVLVETYDNIIKRMDSMIIDKYDNVFFLDKVKKQIFKFNPYNGYMEVHKTINDEFSFGYTDNNLNYYYYDFEYFEPQKLGYNPYNDKMYLMGQSSTPSGQFLSVHEIHPEVKIEAYNMKTLNWNGVSPKFLQFDKDSILYGVDGKSPYIVKMDKDDKIEKEISNFTYKGKIDSILKNGELYIFDTGTNVLSKIDMSNPSNISEICKVNNLYFDGISAHGDKFYLSKGTTIYSLETDGKLKLFIDTKKYIFNKGNAIQEIYHFNFDSKGNLIIYDHLNYAIKKINLEY